MYLYKEVYLTLFVSCQKNISIHTFTLHALRCQVITTAEVEEMLFWPWFCSISTHHMSPKTRHCHLNPSTN